MRLLLDTNVVIWWLSSSERLGETTRSTIGSAEQVYVSPVSAYEINFKRNVGKLEAPDDLGERIAAHGFEILAVSLDHAAAAGTLPVHHRDPFDRLLIAQARREKLTIVTSDRHFVHYDVPVLRATD